MYAIWQKDIMQFADQNRFSKKPRDQFDDIFDVQLLLSESIPNLSSNFITYRKSWK